MQDMEMDAEEKGLRDELAARLDAFEAHGSANLAYLQGSHSWGVDLAKDPLYLIWDGEPKFGYIVRYALAVWNVVGILNRPPGHDFYGMKFSDEQTFREAAQVCPNLAAVMLLNDLARYIPLCEELAVPYVLEGYANQVAGIDSLPQACAPYVRDNLSILDSLADDLSRKTLLAAQLYRLSRDDKWLRAVMQPIEEMYFRPGLFTFGRDEIFIDGGASLGDTVEAFDRIVEGQFRHIHAFEPSPVGSGLMRRAFAKDSRITVHQLGLATAAATIHFRDDVDENGIINGVADSSAPGTVQTEALDNLDLGEVTFIKMDIEGFEVEALQGAKATLRRAKPVMAICAYHKPRDFHDIFETVRAIRGDYRTYLRHYGPTAGDSVFYFV